MHSVLSCLVTDVIGPASLSEDLVAAACAEYEMEGGRALREYVRSIELTIAALGLTEGDQAILSPLAPAAYLLAFEHCGITAVYADVREEDACLDPALVVELAGIGGDAGTPDDPSAPSEGVAIPDTESGGPKAVFVHIPLGRVPDIAALAESGLPLVVDAGEALGARDSNGPLGSGARYLLLPMEPEGIATSGGGTLILAADKPALKALNDASETLTPDAFLPDLNASLGIVQWREYPGFLESRDMLSELFTQALMKGRHRTLADPESEDARAVPFSFPVVLASPMNEVRRYARKKGVDTEPAFAGRIISIAADLEERCPRARSLMMNVLLFPLYPTLGKKNVQQIVKVLSTLP